MTIPMPDPMVEVDKQIVSSELQYTYLAPSGGMEHGTYLITTTQAEAYADARVREALERAAKIVELATQHHHVECWGSLEEQAASIRELIPTDPQPGQP